MKLQRGKVLVDPPASASSDIAFILIIFFLVCAAVHALTATEFKLLHYFMLHPGTVLSKTRLVEHVYDEGFDRDSNLIEVYIRRLRDKLGQQRIQTRRGQGYVLVEDSN